MPAPDRGHEALLIPASVLVEIDYLIHRSLHPGVLVSLLMDVESGAYAVVNVPKLATLDHRHFGVLRPRHVEALRLLPD